MEQVLHAVDRDWAFLVRDVDDALDAQQVLPVDRDQSLNPSDEDLPTEWRIEHQAMGADAVVVAVYDSQFGLPLFERILF